MPRRLLFISRLCLTLCCLGSPLGLLAQTPPPLQVGLGLSGYAYTGDLTVAANRFRRAYPGGAISVQFAGARPLHLQLNAGFGRFVEQAEGWVPPLESGIRPNTFVETSLFYTDLRLRFRPWSHRVVHPYFSAGLGMLFFSPTDKEGNSLVENSLTRLPGEEYNNLTASFPLNAGLMLRINRQVSLAAGYTYRVVASDYLDNIGQLGPRPGNDALHTVDLSLYVSLQPPPILPVAPAAPEPAPLLAQPAPEGLFIPENDATWILLWAWPADAPLDETAVERFRYAPR